MLCCVFPKIVCKIQAGQRESSAGSRSYGVRTWESKSAIRDLMLCKQAIWEVSRTMAAEIPRGRGVIRSSERLRVTMSYLRAVEMQRLYGAKKIASTYAKLTDLADLEWEQLHLAAGLAGF